MDLHGTDDAPTPPNWRGFYFHNLAMVTRGEYTNIYKYTNLYEYTNPAKDYQYTNNTNTDGCRRHSYIGNLLKDSYYSYHSYICILNLMNILSFAIILVAKPPDNKKPRFLGGAKWG